MDGMYTTTNHTVIVHHSEECIECGGATGETVVPSAEEAYKCESCEVTVAEDGGGTVVRGEVSASVVEMFDLEEAF